MKLIKYPYGLLCVLLLSGACLFSFRGQDTPVIQNPRCELLANPEGIDATQPRLSWEIASSVRGTDQTAYRVLVASSAEKLSSNTGDVWDSGVVKSDQTIQVSYQGKPLQSGTNYFWKVKVWTNKGETDWSNAQKWSMGLLKPADWQAKWIGYDHAFAWDSVSKFSRLSARYFRKEFSSAKAIKEAKVYVSGLGYYELYINGNRIGDQFLAPAPTDYTQSVKYNTFDVTAQLKQGNNAIGTILGNGRFFTMRQNYKPAKIKTFGYPKMLLQLHIDYTDGTSRTITSDDTWKITGDGPIRSNNEYDGEEYDATKELNGWANAGYNEAAWLKPELVEAPGGRVVAQMNEKIRVVETLKPKTITKISNGNYVLDMGQNMAGWINMQVKGNKGDKVQLRFAETTKSDGELYVANLRDAKSTDTYTLKGGDEEQWHPRFIYHGFRYVEVVGYPGIPQLNDFTGEVINDDLTVTGSFETSNPLINQIYKNAVWGIKANYKGMPLDCPQRNERMPWLADHATGSYSESFVYDNAKFYAKWLDDIEESQTPEGALPDVAPAYWHYYSDDETWPATYLVVADMLYDQYGDKAPIVKHYESMKKWMTYMRVKYMKDNILNKDKYGDWCVPPESTELIHSKDTLRTTDGHLIATAYYYRMLMLMKRFAGLAGKTQDISEYDAMAARIKTTFNQTFFNPQTKRYSNNSVTSNLLPLYFGMVPGADRRAVFKNITDKILIDNKGHISTGVIGTQFLMRTLTANGRPDIAYRIASNTDYPSWGYMVKNGATTFWELWNGNTANPQMNSQNHVMLLGDLLVWFYENLGGIKTESAQGFHKLVMKPEQVEGLTFVNASYRSVSGMVKSNWKKDGKTFSWDVTIPANTRAVIYVPAAAEKDVTESGSAASANHDLKFLRMEAGCAVFEISSGNYSFKSHI
ncbi:family 78 glycoside hydrolase catalytic domain [Mucilaginibacter sp. AW1-3]